MQTIKLDLATLVARTWRATRRVSFRKVDKHAGSEGGSGDQRRPPANSVVPRDILGGN